MCWMCHFQQYPLMIPLPLVFLKLFLPYKNNIFPLLNPSSMFLDVIWVVLEDNFKKSPFGEKYKILVKQTLVEEEKKLLVIFFFKVRNYLFLLEILWSIFWISYLIFWSSSRWGWGLPTPTYLLSTIYLFSYLFFWYLWLKTSFVILLCCYVLFRLISIDLEC